jgi:hypothetical protein
MIEVFVVYLSGPNGCTGPMGVFSTPAKAEKFVTDSGILKLKSDSADVIISKQKVDA